MKVTVFHASYAKSAFDIATPMAPKRPSESPFGPSATPPGDDAKCDSDPFPLENADEGQQRDRADLQHREHVLHERPLAQAARVDAREHGDDGRGDDLRARQREAADREDDVGLAGAKAHAAEKLREPDRDGRVEPGLDDEKERPSVEERDARPERLAQKDVLPARAAASSRRARRTTARRAASGRRPAPRAPARDPATRCSRP